MATHKQAQFLALKASAGSGKTFSLALRFIYLLFCGANPHQILTLTFTRKASNEMRHRIHDHLHTLKLCLADNTYQNNIIYKDLHEKKGLSHQVLSQNIEKIYANFMQSNPRITTIDSFFHTILKKFCWYVGVSAFFEVGTIDSYAINEAFLHSLNTDEIDNLTQFCFKHKMNVSSFLDFLHLLSKFPTQDIKNALEDGLEPISFSFEEIDDEIRMRMERINEYIQSVEKGHKTLKKGFLKTSAKELIKNPTYILQWRGHTYFANYDLSAFDTMREEILGLLKIYFVKKEQDVLHLIRGYLLRFDRFRQQQSRLENYLSYNDIMLKNYELLIRNIDREFFYFRLDDRITHILLDEFQDTSITQYQILKPIIDEIKSGDSRKNIDEKSLFVVGDEKQSIYMFRGSFTGVFEEATIDLEKENLPYNFRSKPRVIDFNNRVFEKCYPAYVPSQCPNDDIQGGYVRVLESAEDSQSLQEQVYAELQALLQKGADEDNIAILVFQNKDAVYLKDYINAQNPHINIVTQSSMSLFAKKEVRLILNALQYINLLRAKAKIIENPLESVGTLREVNNALKLYEKQICKLQGKAYMDSADAIEQLAPLALLTSVRPSQIVLALIEGFNIANSTTMRFLELSCEYVSIDELLEIESKIQCDAPTQSNKGVKIMTIHKSKGLEFEYVIVCDKMSEPQNDTDKFVYAYDGLKVGRIYYKHTARESFDCEYKEALEAYRKRVEQESINVLYVAFTRAKYGLSIAPRKSKSTKQDSQKNNSSFAKLELESVCDDLPQLSSINQQEIPTSQKPINVLQSLQYFGRQSAFIRQEKEQKYRIFESDKWHNVIFGTALHSVFEMHLGYGMSRDNIYHIVLNRYGFALTHESITQVLAYAFNCMQNPLFTALLMGKEVLCEVSYIIESCLYRIDTLVYDERECFVFDYKSSTGHQEEQEEQVRGYMHFLDTFYNKNKYVRGFIIYPLKQGSEQIKEVI